MVWLPVRVAAHWFSTGRREHAQRRRAREADQHGAFTRRFSGQTAAARRTRDAPGAVAERPEAITHHPGDTHSVCIKALLNAPPPSAASTAEAGASVPSTLAVVCELASRRNQCSAIRRHTICRSRRYPARRNKTQGEVGLPPYHRPEVDVTGWFLQPCSPLLPRTVSMSSAMPS